MKQDFSELFEIIWNKFIPAKGERKSLPSFASYLGHEHKGRVTAWSKGQWPSAHDCWIIHQKMGFGLEWLLTGEGEMLQSFAPPTPAEKYPHMNPAAIPAPPTLPLIGFAACGVGGWHGTMTIPVSVEPPLWHQDMFAVMATGESMLPAGIGHGHICYCDPHKQPGPGEAVYVERMDDSGALKLFLGRSVAGTGEPFINLQGWLDKKPGQPGQKSFNLDVAESYVRCMAPVVYIRRRL